MADHLDYIRIRGLEDSKTEVFQGIGAPGGGGGSAPGLPGIPTPVPEPDRTLINTLLSDLIAYVQAYAEDLQRRQTTIYDAYNAQITAYNQAHPDAAPLSPLPALPDRAGELVKFIKSLLALFLGLPLAVIYENIDKIYYLVAGVKEALDICGKAFDFVVGGPLENGLLNYHPLDVFRLLPKSILKEAMINENTGGTLVEAVEDLALVDVQIKFGDNQSLHVKGRVLHH
jgi:hypothetical protein